MTIMLVHNETLIAEARGRHRDARDTLEALEAARRAGSDVPQRAIDNWRAEVGRTREECRRLRAGRLVRSGEHAHVPEAEARRMLEGEA